MHFRYGILVLLALLLVACKQIAVFTTPKKHPVASNTQLSQIAETSFWNTFHQGHYNDIEMSDRLLTAAYLQNPNDPQLAAHLGFLHIWKITERNREKNIQPMIVNEMILAKKYFNDAVELNPDDARYLGFLADTKLIEGKIFNDDREQVRGYFTLKKAIRAWPQFNYFTGGYVMSNLPADSPHFKEGLEWQWRTLDLCAGEKIDRNNPDYSKYMKLETQQGRQRACWNSWIAPYNFEGFFLNMGDMLAKTGDAETAIKIYNNAKLAKNYSSWPYRSLLEKHMTETTKKKTIEDKEILFNSGYGCVACHQESTRIFVSKRY